MKPREWPPGKKFRSWLTETHHSPVKLSATFCPSNSPTSYLFQTVRSCSLITVLAALACVGPLIVRLYMPKYNYLLGLETGDLYIAAVHADRLSSSQSPC